MSDSEQTFSSNEIGLLIQAIRFAADKHRLQRRKDQEGSPYINHPLQVIEMLWHTGKINDINIIIAGVLHDVLEDTDAQPAEIESLFGSEVLAVVQEVSDDKSLPKEERKRLQIVHAPHLSPAAKQIKLADKISNINDLVHYPPQAWSKERRQNYLQWSTQVIAGLRGVNEPLEQMFDTLVSEAWQKLIHEL